MTYGSPLRAPNRRCSLFTGRNSFDSPATSCDSASPSLVPSAQHPTQTSKAHSNAGWFSKAMLAGKTCMGASRLKVLASGVASLTKCHRRTGRRSPSSSRTSPTALVWASSRSLSASATPQTRRRTSSAGPQRSQAGHRCDDRRVRTGGRAAADHRPTLGGLRRRQSAGVRDPH
jgi:hypothetical protein